MVGPAHSPGLMSTDEISLALPIYSGGKGPAVVQSLICVRLFGTPWIAARQASLSSTVSWSLLRFVSVELMILSNYLILLLPSVFPSIGVFSSELAPRVKWPEVLELQHQSFQ